MKIFLQINILFQNTFLMFLLYFNAVHWFTLHVAQAGLLSGALIEEDGGLIYKQGRGDRVEVHSNIDHQDYFQTSKGHMTWII